MASLPKVINYNSITSSFKDNLISRTGINNLNSDSIASSLYLPLVSELQRISNENRRAFEAIQLDTAIESELDRIAAFVGVGRLAATFAGTDKGEKTFMFYTSQSFGAINGGRNIVLPANTEIRTSSSTENSIVYTTVETYVLPKDSKVYYCQVKCTSAGSVGNVKERSLVRHNFVNYIDSKNNSLLCSNLSSILNGRNSESDESLRYRIQNAYGDYVLDSASALFNKTLEVPGVLKTKIINSYFGIGTVGIFVFGAANRANRKMLETVSASIKDLKSPGVDYIVMPGVVVYLDAEIKLTVSRELSDAEKFRVRQNISTSLDNLFNYQSSSREISLTNIKNYILNSSPFIVGVSSEKGDQKIFKNFYIRKTYGDREITSERKQLKNSFFVLKEEEFALPGILEISYEVSR